MPHGETRTGKASINVKLKQDADKTSERLVLEGASKRHLIFPLSKTGLTNPVKCQLWKCWSLGKSNAPELLHLP